MNNVIKGAVYFVILVLIQALILNNIHFLRLVTPFLYLYFIVKMPVGFTSSRVTFFSFLLGLIIDIFSNTPGMHAAACTFVGFVRPAVIKVLMGDELADTISPSFKTFGYGGFFRYAAVLAALHHVTLFILESLTWFDALFLSIRIVACITATTLLICIVEAFNVEGQKND
ncbi:MAG: rod shape-determining protein MreD [Tannerellaceae bacterium]|jgi:rod shape-determining protein MreD|nr:rod shape-determining protein MreD [Tannerellaceae bacterium]